MSGRARRALALALVLAAATSCGLKGDPRPPEAPQAPAAP